MTGDRPDDRVFVIQSGEFATIGPTEAPTGLFQSMLDLPGGFLTYDVRDLSAPPFAEIHDPLATLHWVARVYGAPVAEQIRSSAPDAVTTAPVTTEHDYRPEDSAVSLARIALGQWLWRFWPSTDPQEVAPLDEGLLRIELAALAWQLDDYFTALQPASMFLDGTLETLHELANRVADDPNAVDRPVGRVVVAALDAAVAGPSGAFVTDDEDLLQSLDDLLARLTTDPSSEVDAGGVAESVEDWLTEQAEARTRILKARRRTDYALTAGREVDGPSLHPSGGRSSVDWRQVPPRCLDWNEDTVRWIAEPLDDASDTWRVTVRVAASSQPDSVQPELMLARAYIPDGTELGNLPVMTIRLVREGDGFVGSGQVQHGDLGALVVDVFSASSVRRPVIERGARDEARRERETARQFIVDRAMSLGLSDGGPDRRFEGEPRADV